MSDAAATATPTAEATAATPSTEPVATAAPEGTNEGVNPASETPKAEPTGSEDAQPVLKAPESYELKAPEGVSQLDSAVIEAYGEVARTLDLSNEQAQAVLDKVLPVMEAQRTQAMQAMLAEWQETIKADKELGGENLEANLATMRLPLKQFGDTELQDVLSQSGLIGHPALARFLFKIGKSAAITGDSTLVTGDGTASKDNSGVTRSQRQANKLYAGQ